MIPKIRLAGLMVALAMVAACTTPSPFLAAENIEAKADALYGEYVIAEEAAAKLMASATVPNDVKAAIQQAHRAVTPVVEALHEQRQLIPNLKVSSPDDLPDAILALDELIKQARPLVDTFNSKVTQ